MVSEYAPACITLMCEFSFSCEEKHFFYVSFRRAVLRFSPLPSIRCITEGFDGFKDLACRDTQKLKPFSQVHGLVIIGYHDNVDIAVFSRRTAGIRTEKNDFLRADPQFSNFFFLNALIISLIFALF
jgi:hypothetical protein